MILESVINKVEIDNTGVPDFKELDDSLRFYAGGVLGFNDAESAEFLRFLVDVSELHGDKVENRDSKEGLGKNKTSEKRTASSPQILWYSVFKIICIFQKRPNPF